MSEPETEIVEDSVVRRAIWLIGVPIGSALLPLIVLAGTDKSLGGLVLLLVAVAPLIGGLGALSYAFVAPVRMWPLVPYITAAALFMFVLLVAANMTSGDGLEFGPVQVIGIVLPVLATAGGVVSYAWEPVFEPEPEYIPKH
jgi:hypothetical protein